MLTTALATTKDWVLRRLNEVTTFVGAAIPAAMAAIPGAAVLPSPWPYVLVALAVLLVVAPGGPKLVARPPES